MKRLLTIILLFGIISAKAQIEVQSYFKNTCHTKIVNDSISFELQNLETLDSFYSENSRVIIPSIGKYELFVTISYGKYERSYEEKIVFNESEKVVHTLTIPKILFETNNDSETDYSKYLKCDKICNGYEVDYFENGNKRLEGTFSNGNAIWETEFERDGSSIKYYYDKSNRYTKWEYYDQNGNLTEYFIYKYKKKHFIQKTYNSKGKLVRREVKIYYPLTKN